MTVGSPPSMTATTLFVVPRSMPMILPIVCALSCWLMPVWVGRTARVVVVVGGGSVGGCGRIRGRGDRDERRPDDPVAELVAATDDVDDLALCPAGARDVGDRLVLARIERDAGDRLDRTDAFALEQGPQLAIDRGDALHPAVVAELRRTVVDREIEVVGD